MIDEGGYRSVLIEVDGGVDLQNAPVARTCTRVECTLWAGNTVLSASDPAEVNTEAQGTCFHGKFQLSCRLVDQQWIISLFAGIETMLISLSLSTR